MQYVSEERTHIWELNKAHARLKPVARHPHSCGLRSPDIVTTRRQHCRCLAYTRDRRSWEVAEYGNVSDREYRVLCPISTYKGK